MMDRTSAGAHFAALITIIIWGTTFVSTKVLLEGMSAVEILFFRFLAGAAALFLCMPHILKWQGFRKEAVFALAGLCGVCLYYLFENIALTFTLASNVSVIISASPFFTALLSHYCIREGSKPSARFYLGFVLAMAGIVMLNYGQSGWDTGISGNLLAMAAAFIWSCYSLLSRKISSFGLNLTQTTRRTFIYGLIFMIPFLLAMDFAPNPDFILRPDVLANLAFLSFGASALCFVTWNKAVSVLGALATSIYIYLVPVVTAVASVLVLREPVTVLRTAGIVLVLAGLVLSRQRQKD